jgi:hypothetical protein
MTTTPLRRMSAAERREQLLGLAAEEFAAAGLAGASTEALFPPVAVKTFLTCGMLLNTAAALELSDVDGEWAAGIRTRITAGLFDHIIEETNR